MYVQTKSQKDKTEKMSLIIAKAKINLPVFKNLKK